MNGDETRQKGRDVRRPGIGGNQRVVRKVVMEDIMGRPKKMKGGKTAGIVVEILKNGGISIIDCLLRILNRCLEFGVGPAEWKKESIVPI